MDTFSTDLDTAAAEVHGAHDALTSATAANDAAVTAAQAAADTLAAAKARRDTAVAALQAVLANA